MQVKEGNVWLKASTLYEKIHAYLAAHGFCNSPSESTTYVRRDSDVLLVIVLYVDDMLLTRPDGKHIADFKIKLNSTFEISDLGPFHHYLGIQLL